MTMTVSLDGGNTFQPATEILVRHTEVEIPGQDKPGVLDIHLFPDRTIINLNSSHDDQAGHQLSQYASLAALVSELIDEGF